MPTIIKPKYTYYIVSRDKDTHYPVLMASNGKPTLNESVTRAHKLETGIARLGTAFLFGQVQVVRITHAEFRQKFPRFPRNQGRKKTIRKA